VNAPVLNPRCTETYQERLARVMPKVPEIRAIIGDLFPGPIEMEIEEDPEIEDWRYLTFSVETQEDLPEVRDRRAEWYRLSGELLGRNCDLVFLHVIFLT